MQKKESFSLSALLSNICCLIDKSRCSFLPSLLATKSGAHCDSLSGALPSRCRFTNKYDVPHGQVKYIAAKRHPTKNPSAEAC